MAVTQLLAEACHKRHWWIETIFNTWHHHQQAHTRRV